METNLVQWLEEAAPNETPMTEMSQWELGVLAGKRMLVEQIKIKLKVEEQIDNEK